MKHLTLCLTRAANELVERGVVEKDKSLALVCSWFCCSKHRRVAPSFRSIASPRKFKKSSEATVNSLAVEAGAISVSINRKWAMEGSRGSHRIGAVSARKSDKNKHGYRSNFPVPIVQAQEVLDPKKLFEKLLGTVVGCPCNLNEKSRLNSIFDSFAASDWVTDQALSLCISSKLFPTAVANFREFFMEKSSPGLRSFLLARGSTKEAANFLFPVFADFCFHEYSSEITSHRELVSKADMTKPEAWYPLARAMKRRVIYHKGPTNSGKTYRALERYMQASSGIYCSPLRLLAMEVFETVNKGGVSCNLHTGLEKKDVPSAKHLSCTVEICNLTRKWEVAVIDEIQMVTDEFRGWAWTRAFLGLQAEEIHVCGDFSALTLIGKLCHATGDEFVEHEHERSVPLKVAEKSLQGALSKVQAGDCIVAFSRKVIFEIKQEIELTTKHRCCVVYGALPAETKTQQAKLFNDPSNGYDVLVATDAIGMGLNLNIRRIVFFSLRKYDGESMKAVPPAQVKQIAGRAGRRGCSHPEGVVTTLNPDDLYYLKYSMAKNFEQAKAAGLYPVYEQLELFASELPKVRFATLLDRFSQACQLDDPFFLCRCDNHKKIADTLEEVKGLSLQNRFDLCFAPVNVVDPLSTRALCCYATAFCKKIPIHFEMAVSFSNSGFEYLDLERRHQILSLYLWLSQRLPPERFPHMEKEHAREIASDIAVRLSKALQASSSTSLWAMQSGETQMAAIQSIFDALSLKD